MRDVMMRGDNNCGEKWRGLKIDEGRKRGGVKK